MPIAIACQCGKHYHARDEHAGKRLKCPACDAPIHVPNTEPREPEVYVIADAPPVEPPALAEQPQFSAYSTYCETPSGPEEQPRAIATFAAVVVAILVGAATFFTVAVISFKGFGVPLDKYAIIKWPALFVVVSAASGAFTLTRAFVTSAVGPRRIKRPATKPRAASPSLDRTRFVQTDWWLTLLLGAATWIVGGPLVAGLSALHAGLGMGAAVLLIAAFALVLVGTRRILTFAEDNGEWVGQCERQLAFFRRDYARLPDSRECRLIVWKIFPNMTYVTLLQGVSIVVGILLSAVCVGVFLIIFGLTLRGRFRDSVMYCLDVEWTGSKRPFRLARVFVPDGAVSGPPLEIAKALRTIQPALPAASFAERSITKMIW